MFRKTQHAAREKIRMLPIAFLTSSVPYLHTIHSVRTHGTNPTKQLKNWGRRNLSFDNFGIHVDAERCIRMLWHQRMARRVLSRGDANAVSAQQKIGLLALPSGGKFDSDGAFAFQIESVKESGQISNKRTTREHHETIQKLTEILVSRNKNGWKKGIDIAYNKWWITAKEHNRDPYSELTKRSAWLTRCEWSGREDLTCQLRYLRSEQPVENYHNYRKTKHLKFQKN